MAKTIKDVIEDVVQEIDREDVSADDKEIIIQIKTIIRELKGDGVTGKDFSMFDSDELSRMGGTLAVLKVSLGEMIARAGRNVSVSEEVTKLKKANIRLPVYETLRQSKDKPTAEDVKAQVNRQVFKDNIRTSFKEEHLQQLQHLWWSVKAILDQLNKRIDVVQGQKADGSWLDHSVEGMGIEGKGDVPPFLKGKVDTLPTTTPTTQSNES